MNIDRLEEIVEISADDVLGKLKLDETAEFIIVDENNAEVPYQLTADNKIIFPATVKAGATASYSITKGQPSHANTVVYGRQYPERLDDVAWEMISLHIVYMVLLFRKEVIKVSDMMF